MTRKFYKKSILTAAVVMMVTLSVISGYAQVFDQGAKQLNLGIGFGGGYGAGSSTTPPISGSFEVGITDKISVGGIIGFSGSKQDFGFGSYSYSYLLFGARGSYHFAGSDNTDFYGGAMLAYNNVSTSVSGGTGFGAVGGSASGIAIGLYVGGRYMFSEKIGAFAELGYSIALVNLGITAKL
ncbi:MAG: hypothetical protein SH819_11265 [Cytophagales bacterium]|nr:hypothetical protein [Cytophagales bacterium]